MSPGVISQMNPGPYRPLCVGGPHVGGSQTNRPSPGGSSRRPMVARPVRYGPVRQKKTFLCVDSTDPFANIESENSSAVLRGAAKFLREAEGVNT